MCLDVGTHIGSGFPSQFTIHEYRRHASKNCTVLDFRPRDADRTARRSCAQRGTSSPATASAAPAWTRSPSAQGQQEAHLLLLRRQGRSVPRRARGDYAESAPPSTSCISTRAIRRRRSRADRVHLEPLCAPRIPRAAQQREHAARGPPQAVAPDPADELAPDRGPRRRAGARRGERNAARRHRPDAALHLDRRARLLLPVEQAHARRDLRARPDERRRARRAPRTHDRCRPRLCPSKTRPAQRRAAGTRPCHADFETTTRRPA